MASAVIKIGDEPLAGAADHQLDAERLALLTLEVLEVADHQDAVTGGDAEHGEESDERAERDRADAPQAASIPPTSATGSVRNSSMASRKLSERGLQQQQDGERGGQPHLQQPALRGLALGSLAQQLDVVAEGRWTVASAGLDGGGHRAKIAAADVRRRPRLPSRSRG